MRVCDVLKASLATWNEAHKAFKLEEDKGNVDAQPATDQNQQAAEEPKEDAHKKTFKQLRLEAVKARADSLRDKYPGFYFRCLSF